MGLLNSDQERRHLAQAEQHIAEAEGRIARQRAIIEELRRNGHEIDLAESTLLVLETSLRAFEHHRDLILQRLENLPSNLTNPGSNSVNAQSIGR
jgi:hypothetical protein